MIFISYAREDQTWAERLYMELRKQELNAWLDIRCLKPGANWKLEIHKTIRKSRYFILLLSKHSLNKRGFVQREIKEALQVMKEFPTGEIFLIPARLDMTDPVDEELQELNWVNLFPNFHDGLARILAAIVTTSREPLIIATEGAYPSTSIPVIDRGRETTTSIPLIIGERAAIRYAPFRTAKEFLQQFFDRLPGGDIYGDESMSYYITFDTRHPDVLLGDDVKATYPEYITVVLQHVFRELQVREIGISVILMFGGVERTVAIPFDAIRQVRIPNVGISIVLESPAGPATLANPEGFGNHSQ